MFHLLEMARVSDYLFKLATAGIATKPPITGENPINLDMYPHGTDAHYKRTAAQKTPKIQHVEGPRAYAPRFNG